MFPLEKEKYSSFDPKAIATRNVYLNPQAKDGKLNECLNEGNSIMINLIIASLIIVSLIIASLIIVSLILVC